MNSTLLIALVILALTLLLGGAVVVVGLVLVVAVLFLRRRGGGEELPEPRPVEEVPQASPAPLTRLESGNGGLHAVPAQPSPAAPPPRPPAAPTLAPEELDEGTEAFGNLDAFFDKLDSASEEDRTELLSKAERERLYGFDVGKEEPERTDYDLVKDQA